MYHPRAMREAPPLDPGCRTPPPSPRLALLINPFYPKDPHASFGKHVLTPTLALTSIAGSTPPGWKVRYWDENLLQGPPPASPFPAVVGITVHLTFSQRAFALAAWYRARGATVVLGGLHVLSNPEECAPHADALCLGEGVQVWPQVLRDIEAGSLRPRYEGSYVRGPMGAYRDEPPPRRGILPSYGFLTGASLIATRGCHNRCGFCYLATDGLKMPYQMRDVEDVAAQFLATGEPYGVFIDNNLGSRPGYLRALARALAPAHRIWSAAVTVDVTDDPDLVREMAAGGCTGVFVGFESLDAGNLDDARKKTPRPEDYARRVAIFHILTPYPGTPLFRQMEGEGRLLHKDWSLYDTAHVVFRPKRMTPEALYRGYAWAYRRVFSHGSIWRRRPERPGGVLPYLGMSYLYKKSNRLWPFLIRHRLTHAAWRPLVELSRLRHLAFRRSLAAAGVERSWAAVPVGGLA